MTLPPNFLVIATRDADRNSDALRRKDGFLESWIATGSDRTGPTTASTIDLIAAGSFTLVSLRAPLLRNVPSFAAAFGASAVERGSRRASGLFCFGVKFNVHRHDGANNVVQRVANFLRVFLLVLLFRFPGAV